MRACVRACDAQRRSGCQGVPPPFTQLPSHPILNPTPPSGLPGQIRACMGGPYYARTRPARAGGGGSGDGGSSGPSAGALNRVQRHLEMEGGMGTVSYHNRPSGTPIHLLDPWTGSIHRIRIPLWWGGGACMGTHGMRWAWEWEWDRAEYYQDYIAGGHGRANAGWPCACACVCMCVCICVRVRACVRVMRSRGVVVCV